MTATERKLRSQYLLQQQQVPYIEHLPTIEEEDEVILRSGQDIARRIVILCHLCLYGEKPTTRQEITNSFNDHGLWEHITGLERDFLSRRLTSEEKAAVSWRSEAVWALLWCIEEVDSLVLPVNTVAIDQIMKRVPEFMTDSRRFVDGAKVRSVGEILDATDLTYRLHWAARHNHLNASNDDASARPLIVSRIVSRFKIRKDRPTGGRAKLDLDVIRERHYAFNWVIGYGDNWDDITTNT